MNSINIVIDDENRYFAEGLRLSIEKYAKKNNKTVCFLPPGVVEPPDMVLASSRRRAQRWGRCAPQVITVKERPILKVKDVARVLYRTDDQIKLFELLNEALSGSVSVLTKRQPLTQRERQVVNYLRCGFDQSQTARLLGVSVKTVHSHKRSVMSKLMLNRNHEFIYWLLSEEGEYS
ncbi:helix-turn-helix transcriptional regulator [Serratia marcescens]|uniref:helix-turn-helix transcriptional regulator n=1 Tax=Serratia TaxID=613 RepID=UPI00066EE20C|nr:MULTISPECIES: LuxR family transcriptional regulator [Serratia]MBM1297384.1 helix-turn-helix transcriptional regulator [Serratia nematodiphila]MBH2576351.1 helix-turn-helix transcriptional regulator [Serratia marcescens]MBH2611619.1 helix-turn-helix transcriptional regulator [Serratia marcescens]MBH2931501.1 helix-turn-helix transcriptional regulator [Serratia marcescens]MBH2942658.1 helix-turn-helix transcriptional regulator [Serratia marcescens]